jgi:phosphomevalonate kinase
VVEVFGSPVAVVTREFLAKVRAFAAADGRGYRGMMNAVTRGAEAAVVGTQLDAFVTLGAASGAGIVTAEVAALRIEAATEHAVFLPSGAGGGDIALFVGGAASSAELRRRAAGHGLLPLGLRLGAEGTTLLL